MATHQYTPQQAFELFMRTLTVRDKDLAAEVQAAVDQGKDVEETEALTGSGKQRRYRKTRPYTYEEALQVAVDTLRAYFIEQPLFVNSFYDNIRPVVLGAARSHSYSWGNVETDVSVGTAGAEKASEIELRTETQLQTADQLAQQETQPLTSVPAGLIDEQQRQLALLRTLVDFENV